MAGIWLATEQIQEDAMEGQIDRLTGQKHDSGKVRLELLSAAALEDVAQVMTFGAVKYGDHNWRGGFKWTRIIGAVLRHIFAWMRGVDKDPESGLNPLAHAMCGLMFLLEFYHTKAGEDDRYFNPGTRNS